MTKAGGGSLGETEDVRNPTGTNKSSKRCCLYSLPPSQDRPLHDEHWALRREKTDHQRAIPWPFEDHRKRGEVGAAAVISLGNFLSWDQGKTLLLWLLGYGEVPGIGGPRALRRNQGGIRWAGADAIYHPVQEYTTLVITSLFTCIQLWTISKAHSFLLDLT